MCGILPPSIRGTWFARNCGVFRPQCGQFPGPNRGRVDWFYMRKTHLTFALKCAIAYARARIRVQALLRECRPWMQPHGAPWGGCFGRNATSQSGPVGRFEVLGRVGILSNAPKRLLGGFPQAGGGFSCPEYLHPMPECIADNAMRVVAFRQLMPRRPWCLPLRIDNAYKIDSHSIARKQKLYL